MQQARNRFGGSAAIATAIAIAAVTVISTATASSKETAAGTIAVTERTLVLSYRDGNDIVRELQVRRTLTGTFSGTEVSLVHNVTHPDGSADLTVVSSCSCTVEGRTGTVTFSERATVDLAGVITVRRKIIDATGGLEGLRGRLEVSDLLAAPAQAYTGRYDLD
ncbi:MAG: DUF3224 domain-containing protein [Actinobacteria bacterium]|nr:DUF3224 domain-containing protein [Actinomycetota bacterium]